MKLLIKDKIKLGNLKNGGLFMTIDNKTIGVKSEYCDDSGAINAYIVGSGERFWGDVMSVNDLRLTEVFELEIEREPIGEPKSYTEADMREAFFAGFNRGIFAASVIMGNPIDETFLTCDQYMEKKKNNLK
ncbi:MAG: hypothetical protein EHM34_02370 [Nitrosopumilales archaeon]|nr:MAG: hypothetical protein EHM34_02370 [Nitrosopumilales archaeon]